MSISRTRPNIVYHYCSLDTFFAIFSNSTIRLSDISKSNDSEEITYLLPKMRKFCVDLFNYHNDSFPSEYKLQSNFINDVFDSKFNVHISDKRNAILASAVYSDYITSVLYCERKQAMSLPA